MMKINVEQYQALFMIPSGTTGNDYTERVLDIFNIDGSKYTIVEINKIINDIKIPKPEELKKMKVTIDNKKFTIVNDIMKSSFNEWIQYEAIVGSSPDDETIIKNLHKILAIFVRPTVRKWFRNRIQPLEETDIDVNEKMMLKMSIDTALSINVFFYLREMNFMENIKKSYLNKKTREAVIVTDTKSKLKV